MKPTTLTRTTTPHGVKQNTERLLALSKITPKDIEKSTAAEIAHFNQQATKMINQLKGGERDAFLEKMELILPASTNNDIWDYNHNLISNAISTHMCRYGLMPNQRTIADQTGLSRQTIAKHLVQYKQRPEIAAEMEQFELMMPNVLAKVFQSASKGDMKAARLYFETVGVKEKRTPKAAAANQHNYIQINNTILSQENLARLTADQLNQIEQMLAAAGVVKAKV